MVKREWASCDQDFIRNLTKAGIKIDSIYDIGASNGTWSWYMAQVVRTPRSTSSNLWKAISTPRISPMYCGIGRIFACIALLWGMRKQRCNSIYIANTLEVR